MKNKTDLVRITSKYFCAGLELNDKLVCVNAANIIKYMNGKTFKWVISYCHKKNWKIEYHSENGKVWYDFSKKK